MSTITREQIEELDRLLQIEEAKERRARELSLVVPKSKVFVAVLGVELDFDQMDIIDKACLLRKVTNPPGQIDVWRAANPELSDCLGVGRYSPLVGAELACGDAEADDILGDSSSLVNASRHVAALLKLRGHRLLVCPAVSTSSWDTIRCITNQSINFTILDDVPRQIYLGEGRTCITSQDIAWVRTAAGPAGHLRNPDTSARFGLAFDIARRWNHTTDSRIAIAALWAGIEALFGKQDDYPVTHKLAERISDWLPSCSVSTARHLYKRRCDAVHGRRFDGSEITSAMLDSERILRDALVKCIDTNALPLPDWI
jgi:hypothetical protein